MQSKSMVVEQVWDAGKTVYVYVVKQVRNSTYPNVDETLQRKDVNELIAGGFDVTIKPRS